MLISALLLIVLLSPVATADKTDKDAQNKTSKLIKQLGASTWEKREEAQKDLVDLSTKNADVVTKQGVEAFLSTDDPEVRLRARQVLRCAVLGQKFIEKKGFLGVTLRDSPVALKHKNKLVQPIQVVSVVPESVASTNGFLAGDKIIEADGQTCGVEFNTSALVKYIKSLGAGKKMTFVVYTQNGIATRRVQLGSRPLLPGDLPPDQEKDSLFADWFMENVEQKKQEQREATGKRKRK